MTAASPAIRPNYLADELDRRTLVAGMKIARRIVNNKALDRYRAFEMDRATGARPMTNCWVSRGSSGIRPIT